MQLRLRVDRNEVPDIDAELGEIGLGMHVLVETQFHLGPVGGLIVDLVVEGMTGGHQRQDGSAKRADVGEQGDARTLGEAAGPAAQRQQREPAVVLDQAHRGAERIQMRHHGAGRPVGFALDRGADRATPRQFIGNAQFAELAAGVVHDLVGKAHGTRDRQQLKQGLLEIFVVNVQLLHVLHICIHA